MSFPHFGELIHKRYMEVRSINKALSIAEFARLINIDRSTVYNLFEQRSTDVHKLMRISQVLNFNFLCKCECCNPSAKKITVSFELDSEQLPLLNLPKDTMCRLLQPASA